MYNEAFAYSSEPVIGRDGILLNKTSCFLRSVDTGGLETTPTTLNALYISPLSVFFYNVCQIL